MISEELAQAIFRKAIADGRAAESLEALLDGGMVVLDPVDDRLRIVDGDEFRGRFGTDADNDDPLHPLMPTGRDQPFRDWKDFVERVARPLVESTSHETEQAAMALYRKASPYYICVALVMAANRIPHLWDDVPLNEIITEEELEAYRPTGDGPPSSRPGGPVHSPRPLQGPRDDDPSSDGGS